MNSTGDLVVTLVEPYATDDGALLRPPAKDVYSLYRLPGRAVDLLAAICERAGYADTAALSLQYTRGRGGLGPAVMDRLKRSHVVGISAITRTAPPAYELAGIVRRIHPEAFIFFGGPHTTALPREALRHGDVVILREGDHTIVELLDRVRENRAAPHWDDVPGIAYKVGGEVVRTPPRPFLTNEQLNALPFPRFSREVLKKISNQVMITSRGCPHGCKYCSVIENFGKRYRALTPERMYEYYEYLTTCSRKDIFIGDDNFTANFSRVKTWCEMILTRGARRCGWSAQVRVEAARDRELLYLMRRAGCNTVMIGLESVNDKTLKLWNKQSSLEKNREAIEGFQAAKISVHGMFVLGSEEDTGSTVQQTVDFAKRLNLSSAQFFSITPLPGTPLTRKYDEEGVVLNRQWQLYDGQHVVVHPGRMNAAELQRGIMRAHEQFYTCREGIRHLFLPSSPQRFFNCLVRFAGKRLTRKICRAVRPHLDALDRLEQWRINLEQWRNDIRASLAGMQDRLVRLAGTVSEDVALRKERLREAVDQAVDRLRESIETLKEEYHPYCRRLLEKFRADLLAETEAILLGA